MAKKKDNLNVGQTINTRLAREDAPASVVVSNKKTADKKKIKNNEKPNFFQKIGRSFKEMFSELKKVTWLTPKSTVAKLGTVLAVVVAFLLVVMGFDALCSFLLNLLIQK